MQNDKICINKRGMRAKFLDIQLVYFYNLVQFAKGKA